MFADKKWCLWHRDCEKVHFCHTTLIEQLHQDCWTDGADRFPNDASGVTADRKMLDAKHGNKNAINGYTLRMYTDCPEKRQQIGDWCLKHKPGAHCSR